MNAEPHYIRYRVYPVFLMSPDHDHSRPREDFLHTLYGDYCRSTVQHTDMVIGVLMRYRKMMRREMHLFCIHPIIEMMLHLQVNRFHHYPNCVHMPAVL